MWMLTLSVTTSFSKNPFACFRRQKQTPEETARLEKRQKEIGDAICLLEELSTDADCRPHCLFLLSMLRGDIGVTEKYPSVFMEDGLVVGVTTEVPCSRKALPHFNKRKKELIEAFNFLGVRSTQTPKYSFSFHNPS